MICLKHMGIFIFLVSALSGFCGWQGSDVWPSEAQTTFGRVNGHTKSYWWAVDSYSSLVERAVIITNLCSDQTHAQPPMPVHPSFWRTERANIINVKSWITNNVRYFADDVAMGITTDWNGWVTAVGMTSAAPNVIFLTASTLCVRAGAPTNYFDYTPWRMLGGNGPAIYSKSPVLSGRTTLDYGYKYMTSIVSQLKFAVAQQADWESPESVIIAAGYEARYSTEARATNALHFYSSGTNYFTGLCGDIISGGRSRLENNPSPPWSISASISESVGFCEYGGYPPDGGGAGINKSYGTATIYTHGIYPIEYGVFSDQDFSGDRGSNVIYMGSIIQNPFYPNAARTYGIKFWHSGTWGDSFVLGHNSYLPDTPVCSWIFSESFDPHCIRYYYTDTYLYDDFTFILKPTFEYE